MVTNQLTDSSLGMVNLINQLNAQKLLTVLEMSLTECGPLERAWSNYYYAPERQTYNDLLGQLELTQFQILDIDTPPEMPFDEIEAVVMARIAELRQEAQTVLKNRQTQFDTDWQQTLIHHENSLSEKASSDLWRRVSNDLSEKLYKNAPSFAMSWLQGWLLTWVLVFVFGKLSGDSYFLAPFNYIIYPIKFYLYQQALPYNPEEFWLHFTIIHMAGVFLALPIAAIVHTCRGIRHSRWEKKQVDKESHRLAKAYYQQDKQLIQDYQAKPYDDFVSNGVVNQLYARLDLWQWQNRWSDLQTAITTHDQILADLAACEEQFPSLLAHISQLDQAYEEALEIWENRVEAGQSMAMTLPQDYRQSSTLLALHHYVTNGRAENWKEAVNLMHTEAEFAEIKNRFDYLNQRMDGMQDSLYQLVDELEYQGQAHLKALEDQAQDYFQANRQLNAQLNNQNAQLAEQATLLQDQNRVMNVMLLTQLLSY